MYIDTITVEQGLIVVHDVYGRVHILNEFTAAEEPSHNYIWEWAYHTDNWANTNTFQDLYDTDSGNPFSITTNDVFYIDILNMAQTGDHVSLVALVVDGTTQTILPLLENHSQVFENPIPVPAGSVITVKVKPSHKNTKVAVTLRGYYN